MKPAVHGHGRVGGIVTGRRHAEQLGFGLFQLPLQQVGAHPLIIHGDQLHLGPVELEQLIDMDKNRLLRDNQVTGIDIDVQQEIH